MRKFFKILGYIIGSIILILLGVVVWLQTPSGKNFVREKAVAFLRNKLKTEVYIGAINYRLPKMLELDNVLFKDQAKDTLLAAEKLRVDINMLALIRKKVVVQQIELVGLHAHIYRNAPDTNYNFTYIINAFVGAPKQPTPQDLKKANDTSSSLSFNVDKINLDSIHVRFDDITGGTKLSLDLDQLRLSLKKIDPSKMDFGIKKLAVTGLRGSFMQDTSYLPPKVDTTPAPEFHIAAEEIKIDQSSFTYGNKLSKFLFDIDLGNLLLKPKNIDISKEIIDLKDLKLANTAVKIWMGKTSQKTTTAAAADTASSNWRVTLTTGNLESVSFKMDNENSPRQKTGIDYMHLDAKNLNLSAEDLLYSSDTISGNIKHLAVKEQSGFDLRELHTQFAYHNKGATLRNFLLQTDQTVLQNYAEVGYPSLDALKKNMQQMQLKIDLEKSVVGVKDLLIFMPSLLQYDILRANRNGHLRLDAILQGTLGNLAINKLALSGLGHTEVALDGKITGMPDANKLAYNLNLKKVQSARNDIISFLPKSVADQIRLPDVFGVTGQVSGTVQDYKMQLMLASTDGKAYIKGYVFMSPGKNREQYDLYLRTEALNLGRILKQEQNLGKISANFSMKGRSFDVKNMTASLNGAIQSAAVKGYTYTGIKLDGKVAGKKGILNLVSNDKSARLSLHANADFQKKYPAAVADLNIDSIDLQALKLSASDARISSQIHLDAPVLNADYPQASLVVQQLTMVMGGERYFQDSLYVVSAPKDSSQHIVADFRVLQAEINGHMPLTRIGDVVQEHLDRHYMVHESVKKDKGKKTVKPKINLPANYDLTLTANIEDGPSLHTLMPDLRRIDTVKLAGKLDPASMTLNASLRRLVYGNNFIRGVKADISEADSALNYTVFVERYSQKQIRLLNTKLNGIIRSNEITANLNTQDTAKKDRFAMAASMHQQGNDRVIELGNRLLLNYKEWNVQKPNSIVLSSNGFYVQNFKIMHDDESIDINSKTAAYNAPLTVTINNFHLSDVTGIISNPDTLLADGILSGHIDLEQIKPSPMIAADLKIRNLAVLRDTIGDLTATARNTDNNTINTNIAISGNENDIQLSGVYHVQPVNGSNFNMHLALNALSLKSMEGLAMQQIHKSSGFLKGGLDISGTTAKPIILGEVHTENLATTVSMLNADFHMPAEKIAFTEEGINFQQFKILDSAGNAFTIDGYVYTKDLSNLELDLKLKARKWRALHSTAKDNKIFYGEVLLSSNLHIQGPLSGVNVDGSVNVLKGTNFTFVLPDKNPEIESTDGIVVFINRNDSLRRSRLTAIRDTIKRVAISPGSDISVNVGVDPEAQFNVIIDQGTGDYVTVKGSASLNASVTPGGVIGLTGIYELKDGAYQLNYNFLRRKFNIKSGSTITFAGDPLDANLDITAVYIAQAAPYDLVEKQVTDQSQLNYYKERLPFDVNLMLKGPIMQPLITFDVVLPEGKNYRLSTSGVDLVRSRLTQIRNEPSEMNKQVFSLLLLNRFIGEDPFASGVGSSAEFAAKQSVSRFISDQLNNYASSLIKGVDLNVDLATQEDYTSGERAERTDLNISASKQLLNDRLTVTVGNNFELSGPQSSSGQNASLIPGNLAADYRLTTDGRYTVRAYRVDQNTGALEGYVTETGLNFIVTLDYNRFKNLFNRKKRKREQEAKEQQLKQQKQQTKDTTTKNETK